VRLLLAILLASACGGDDDAGDGGTDAASSTFGAEIVQRSCAPNDGPALSFSFGAGYDPETCTIDFDARAVTISIYLDEWDVVAPATFTFDSEDFSGSGSDCPAGDGPCITASAGEIHLDTFGEDEGATGSWQLTTEAGTISARFDAEWCEGEGGPFCG
jgi:hypothetical protein